MRKQLYFNLLIFCAFWSQGIAVISNENNDDQNYKSTDSHVRKKRIINKLSGGTQPAHITMSRHIVQVATHDDGFQCAGSILQNDIILIPRNCFHGGLDKYSILSGSLTKNNGTSHRVVKILSHPISNIALLLIRPSINLHPRGSQKINIFRGPIPPNSFGHFSGWGCTEISPTGQRIYPLELMATLLPIITHQECYRAIMRTHMLIPSTDILCTLDPHKEKGACDGDEGGSLVIDGLLIGIYSYNGGVNLGVNPEVYVKLNDENIVQWIYTNVNLLKVIGARHFGI